MFILTGSQQFSLIRGMRETLAGRVLLLDLPVLTCHERAGSGETEHWIIPLLKTGAPIRESFIRFPDEMSPLDAVFRGGLPGIAGMSDDFINPYFKSYVQTYLERDLPAQFDMRDAVQLSRFLHLLAPLSSHEINKNQIGRELGVSPPTADRWLSWLKSSLVWHEHEPYYGNIIKRISKHPKGFLFDTGLICGLLHVPDTGALASHPLLGSLFETAMRIEIEAAIANSLMPAFCRHWRTPYGQEVDLVIEYGGRLFAFECRWSSRVASEDAIHLRYFKKQYGNAVAFMGILTPFGRPGLVDEDVYQIPWFLRE